MGRGSFENTVVTAPCDCDPLSGLTPSAALRFLQDAATAGTETSGLGHDELYDRYGLVFVVAAHAVRFFRPVFPGETVTVHTDPMGTRGAHFFRQTLFTAPNGTLLIEAQTDWSLIDAASGRPQRATAYPGVLDVPGEWKPFCDPSRLNLPAADSPCGEHLVTRADTDENRHMNNTVYAKLMTDCFSDKPSFPIEEFCLRYQRQAREGEAIALSRAVLPGGVHAASGTIGGSVCFTAAFSPFRT